MEIGCLSFISFIIYLYTDTYKQNTYYLSELPVIG
jgi:hypothetical protein